jgi:hypothetical protein
MQITVQVTQEAADGLEGKTTHSDNASLILARLYRNGTHQEEGGDTR